MTKVNVKVDTLVKYHRKDEDCKLLIHDPREGAVLDIQSCNAVCSTKLLMTLVVTSWLSRIL